jgi:putative inorganic carbon (HCO3(-)) transporter
VVALAISLKLGSSPVELTISALAVAGLVAAVYIARVIDPAWLLSAGIATDVFVGNGAKLGVPVSPSRVLIIAGSIAVIARAMEGGRSFPIRPQPLHVLLLVVSVWALGSAFLSGTLHQPGTTYELLDRLGVIPFWLFFLAPLAFATESQRRILLGTLVALGAYLGLTALFEILKLNAFVWPKYILDPRYGSHGDRARGPFVEAIANGMAMFSCAVAAGMAMAVWRERPRVRNACGAVLGLCVAGCLFTLTKEVWIGTVVGGLAALAGFAELRRFVLPSMALGAAITVVALATVPGFAASFHSRTHDESSLWVRKNVARAAVNMIDAKPLLGFGWNGFVPDSAPYFRAADTYPLKGLGVPVHNLLLRNAVELGLIGTALWALAIVLAVGGAILSSPDTPELRVWRIGMVALALDFLVIINFAPSSYAFPTTLLWTWAGLLGSPLTLPELAPERRRRQLALVAAVE